MRTRPRRIWQLLPRADVSKRTALVEAAKALLWERGYEATSPRDVLDRSGAGQGSLYHHFSGKLDLARAALEEVAAEEIGAMDALFDPLKPPLERVYTYLRRERDALRGCRLARLANETAIEMPEFRQPIAEFLDRVAGHVRASLEEAQVAGQLRLGVSPSAVAAALVAVVEGGFVLARAHWDADRMAQAVDGGLELLRAAAVDSERLAGLGP